MEPEIAWHLHTAGFCLWSLQAILMVSSYQSCGFLHFLTFEFVEGLLLLSLFYTTFKKGFEEFWFSKGEFILPTVFSIFPPFGCCLNSFYFAQPTLILTFAFDSVVRGLCI